MGKAGPEKRLQKDFQYSLGCAFPGTHYIRVTHPDVYEESGKPDMVGHIFGMHIEIELKVDGNYPSPNQREQLRRVNESGGFGCVLIHHRKDKKYYLIHGDNITNFSYRDRKKEKWVELTHSIVSTPDGNRTVINLNNLHMIMLHRLTEKFT